MTEEEKQLLLQDLCARLPYEVKITFVPNEKIKDIVYVIDGEYSYIPSNYTILNEENIKYLFNGYWKEYKPYLFPLSSMTEEQKEFLRQQNWCIAVSTSGTIETTIEGFDWLNKNHFDYRGLIPLGLAIEAPKGMY